MSEVQQNVFEIGNVEKKHTPLEYVYMTIPAEYVCVYHRILAMLADYGEEMLKDCKATCKDRNSGVIECFNMFNAAVAARKLGNDDENNHYTKLAATLIKYIKTKINQIYSNKDNSPSFVFPVDENGQLKAFVSCGERPRFWISAADGELYEHKFDNGFDEHFRLGAEDKSTTEDLSGEQVEMIKDLPNNNLLAVQLRPSYENISNDIRPCADIWVTYGAKQIDVNLTDYQYYFDDEPVVRFNDVVNIQPGVHKFECVVNYKNRTAVDIVYLEYEA